MAARNRYVPLSMIVDVGVPWTPAHPFILTGPKEWRPALSRVIFHETIHYWQYISHTHLVRLIEEDWSRLKRFEQTGEILPPGKLRRAFVERSEKTGFSTQDLLEAHARFWDVQALSPPLLIELELDSPNRDTSEILTRAQYEQLKADGQIWLTMDERGEGSGYSSLSFNLAMRLASGRYAVPYLELLAQTNDLIAAALFPLCAHFALHTESPPDFYHALVSRLAPRVDLPSGHSIESAWRSLYVDIWREAALLHMERHDSEFYTGQATIHDSSLFHEHVGYRMAHTMLSLAVDHVGENRPPEFLVGPQAMPHGMRALWTMDYLLGCCGMMVSREPDILAFIAPPAVRFTDGRFWNLPELYEQFPYQSGVPSVAKRPPPRLEVIYTLRNLDAKWSDMQFMVLGA